VTDPNRTRPLLVLLATALLAMPAAADPVTATTSEVYYDVSGVTTPEIARSVHQHMPDATKGFPASTVYYYAWRYDYAADVDAAGKPNCAVKDAKVEITITTHLPRHPTIRSAPDDIVSLWKNYSVALKRHEGHHATDFIAIGQEIPAALDAVTTPDCSTIEAVANAVGDDYVARAQTSADDYDDATDHGTNDGASFPGL
jgi:predicted secreted Zn-dependent protease